MPTRRLIFSYPNSGYTDGATGGNPISSLVYTVLLTGLAQKHQENTFLKQQVPIEGACSWKEDFQSFIEVGYSVAAQSTTAILTLNFFVILVFLL